MSSPYPKAFISHFPMISQYSEDSHGFPSPCFAPKKSLPFWQRRLSFMEEVQRQVPALGAQGADAGAVTWLSKAWGPESPRAPKLAEKKNSG